VVFNAHLTGDARPLDNAHLLRALAAYPASTLLTLPRILWQALRLRYKHRLPVHTKPAPSSPQTFRSTYPSYVSEFQSPRLRPRPAAATTLKEPRP
jgi:DUF1365 family protein